jgi:polysaccharide export outer membrane protein
VRGTRTPRDKELNFLRYVRWFTVVTLLLLIPRLSVPAQGADPQSDRTVLTPGDLLRVTVWRQPEMSGEFVVGPDGNVAHPLYRELHVAGVPVGQLDTLFRTFLRRYESNPSFTVFPLLRVIVGGEVRQPNILTLPPGTTVVEAIARAGGPTERGRLDQVRLLRGQATLVLDLTQPDRGALSTSIRSGDQIVVPRRRNLFQDVVAPASSVLAAAAALTSIFIQLNNRK